MDAGHEDRWKQGIEALSKKPSYCQRTGTTVSLSIRNQGKVSQSYAASFAFHY